MTKAEQVLHEQALDRFKLVCEAEREQRLREKEALEFEAGNQWPDDVKTARAGLPPSGSSPAIPARPMLTIRSLDQSISQVVNQGRQADLAIKVSPRKDATRKDADVFEGLVRNIEHESHAQAAYLWAYQRAVICGRGFFRIDKEYADEDGHAPRDQVARIRRILNQGSVYLDPFAQAADWHDGEFAFVTEDIPVARYQRRYPKSDLASMDDQTFTSLGDEWRTLWMPGNDEARCYRVSEYWFLEYDDDQHPIGLQWSKLNGVEFIDPPQEWDAPDIPIIPILGREFNLGGKRLFQGMVEPAMDSCRMINYMASSLVEQTGLVSKAPYIGAAGQFESFEGQWIASNARNQPYVEYNATTDDTGQNLLPPPQRNLVEPPIQAMTQSIAVFTNFVRSTTGVPDAALGHINPNDKSGKAIEALKQSSEMSTSNWIDGLRAGIQRAGEVLVNLVPKIYDRPGRIVQLLGADDEQDAVMVNQPFANWPGQGPVAMPPGAQAPSGVPIEHYDLAKGRYNVVVEVGKSFSTRREEGMTAISALIQANPALAPVVADLWVGDMDFPGAEAISERLHKMLPPQLQEPENGQAPPIPPQIQQKLAMSGKLIEELSAHVNQLTEQIKTDQVKAQAKLEETKIDNATKIKIAMIQASAQLAAVDAKVNAENARTFVESLEARFAKQLDAITAHVDRGHEAMLQDKEHQHDRTLAAQDHVQSTQQDFQAHRQAMEQSEQEHSQTLDQQAQAADLAPEPEGATE